MCIKIQFQKHLLILFSNNLCKKEADGGNLFDYQQDHLINLSNLYSP